MKQILISGASGFFGKNILRALENSDEEAEYICVYNKTPIESSCEKIKWVHGDLLNTNDTANLIKCLKPTHLLHLAWHVPPKMFWTAKENYDWLYASINLFEFFCQEGGKVFVGAGTLAEYDWKTGFIDESTSLNPNTLYGQCKKSLYEILLQLKMSRYPNTTLIWPRIGYFFGPGESPDKLIPKLISHLKKGISMDLASPGFKRPYAHVRYLSDIFKRILFNGSMADAAFNMSASTSYSLSQIVDYAVKKLGIKNKNINFGVYDSMPMTLSVENKYLDTVMNFTIPDTFFEDLEIEIDRCLVG